MAQRAPQQKTHTIAWDGITVQVPDDWHVTGIGGDEKGGNLRIDGPEINRIEITWSDGGSFVNVDKSIDKYLEDTRKLRRKKLGEEIEIVRGERALSRGKLNKSGVKTFSWEGSERSYGAAWLCRKCGRFVFMQLIGAADDAELRARAEQIIGTTRDHSDDDWKLWSVYGFGVWVPERYRPAGQKLQLAKIEMSFKLDTEVINVARWGLADVVLKRQSLEDWARQELWKQVKQYHPSAEPVTIRGHQGVRVFGDAIMFHNATARFIAHVRGKLYADRATVNIWHCEQENKIFVVHTVMDIANAGLCDEMTSRIQCHEGVGG